jgi:hypothetical protein
VPPLILTVFGWGCYDEHGVSSLMWIKDSEQTSMLPGIYPPSQNLKGAGGLLFKKGLLPHKYLNGLCGNTWCTKSNSGPTSVAELLVIQVYRRAV